MLHYLTSFTIWIAMVLLLFFIILYCIGSATSTFLPNHALRVRTTPGTTSGDVIATIKEGLDAAKLDKRGGLTATQRFE
jgi:hypothetical protein